MTKIREIFTSIQGEGPFVGYKQLFIRFCNCNLSCKYCDTDFDINKAKDYSSEDLLKIINRNQDCHSISLTGGEPLLNTECIQFLAKQLKPLYLETNGILYDKLSEVIDCLTYISADVKLPSCTGLTSKWEEHDKFFQIASKKILFAKAVFDNLITDEEIEKMCILSKKYNIELVLQPMMKGKCTSVNQRFMLEVLNKSLKIYSKVRLIPQIHKFIDVE